MTTDQSQASHFASRLKAINGSGETLKSPDVTTVLTSKPESKGEFFSFKKVEGHNGADPADDPAWQRLWLSSLRRSWRSLSLVPSFPDAPMVRMAQVLAVVGQRHLEKPIIVIDAVDLQLDELGFVMDQLMAYRESGQTVIVALGLVTEKPPCLSVAQATDGCLLCLKMGRSKMKDANRIIEDIGREKFIGSFALKEEKRK